MVFERIKFLATNVAPKPEETTYWIDTWSNPYGGVVKYYNGKDWVKLDQLTVAEDYNRLRNKPTLNDVIIEGNKTSKDYNLPGSEEIDSLAKDIISVTNRLDTYIQTNDGNVTEIKADITKIKESLELLFGESTSEVIDKFNEILSFLEGFNDSDKLKTILDQLEQKLTELMNNVVNNIKYNTELPEQLVTPIKLGGIKQGTTVKQLRGNSFISMFDRLLFEDVQPSIQNPSVSLSVKGSWANNGIYEVGAPAPSAESDFTYQFNRGICTVSGQPNKYRAGAENSHQIKLNQSAITPNTKIALNEMRYSIIVNYGIGDELLTSHGNKASVKPNPLPAGNVTANVSVFGTYPYFCNGKTASSSNQDGDLPLTATPDTKLPLQKWTDILVGAKFASEAATGTRLEFKFPSTKNVTKVEFFNTVSGKWEIFADSNYTIADAGNISIHGSNVAYKKLTTQGAMSGALQLRFTLSNLAREVSSKNYTYNGDEITYELIDLLESNSSSPLKSNDSTHDNILLDLGKLDVGTLYGMSKTTRPTGVASFAVNFEPGGQTPLDARTVVGVKEDLVNPETYASKNYYQGMMVVVKSTQEVYILKDVSKITSPDYSGWKRIDGGSATQVTVENTLTSTSTSNALSAAQGKALNDSKLNKQDVINNVTTNDASKALSAAQGKVIWDKINSLGNVYKYRGTKNNISEVIAITNAVVGDVWNIETEFSIGGKKYPAGTNVACIKNTSTSEHTEANWDSLGGTVDLSVYSTKTEMNTGLNSKVAKSDIINDLTTGGTTKVLSAEQGKILNSTKFDKNAVVDNVVTDDPAKAFSARQGKQLNDKFQTLNTTVQNAIAKIPTKVSQLANDSNYLTSSRVLTKDNADTYTPSADYHPATKKYVDDKVATGSGSNFNFVDFDYISVNELTNDSSAEQVKAAFSGHEKLKEDSIIRLINVQVSGDWFDSGVGHVEAFYTHFMSPNQCDFSYVTHLGHQIVNMVVDFDDGRIEVQRINTDQNIPTNVESANKLATPRKIFGQTFDGTADAVGDCTVETLLYKTAVDSNYVQKKMMSWSYSNGRDEVTFWVPGNENNQSMAYNGYGLTLQRGSVSAPDGFYEQSDQRLKTNIRPIEIKDDIELVEFDWKESGNHSYGVIAQQIEKSYPELVDNTGDYKTVKYDSVLIVKCAQLEQRINKLEKELEELKNGKNSN